MDRGAWQAAVSGITESDMTEQLTCSHFPTHFISHCTAQTASDFPKTPRR